MMRSLSELKAECDQLGLHISALGKVGKKDYINVLQKYYLQNKVVTPGLKYRLSIESPQLAFLSANLRPDEIKRIMESDRIAFETKMDGVRMIVPYHPNYGFEFYGRNLSVQDYLPVSYTNNVYISEMSLKGLWDPFVLDTELVSTTDQVSTVMGKRGVITETILQAVSALLALNPEDSIRIQKELNRPLKFYAFDCLYFKGHDLRGDSYTVRRQALSEVMGMIEEYDLPFEKLKAVVKDKQEYLNSIWEEGGEGVIAKPIDLPYIGTSSRPRKGWIKFKKTVSGTIGDTVDGFVTGFERGDSKRGFSNLIGALWISIYVKNGNRIYEHPIARVANFPLEDRRKWTKWKGAEMLLESSLYGMVVEIEGQAISSRVKRFTHPRLVRFRYDKVKEDCLINESSLEKMIR